MAVTEIRTLHNGAKIYECASSDIGSLPAAPVDSCAVVTDSPGLLMIVDASGDWQQAPQTSRDFAGAPGRVGTLASVAALHDSQQITQNIATVTTSSQTVDASVASVPSTVLAAPASSFVESGQTLVNAVTNGDFSGGTTGWTAYAGTLSVTNKILSVNGNGVDTYVRANRDTGVKAKAGDVLFFYAKNRVTNALCTEIFTFLRDGSVGNVLAYDTITSPSQNVWYELYGKVTVTSDTVNNVFCLIDHRYADAATASGKVMEVDGNTGVFAINLTALGLTALTDEQMANLCRTGYFSGMASVGAHTVKATGKNLFDWADATKVVYGTVTVDNGRFTCTTTGNTSGYLWAALVSYDKSYVIGNTAVISENTTGAKSATFTTGDYTKAWIKIGLNGNAVDSKAEYLLEVKPNTTYRVTLTAETIESNRVVFSALQIEEGTTATTYEAYTDTLTTIDTPLRRVPNGVCDTLDLCTGQKVQRVQEYTLVAGDFTEIVPATNVDLIVTTKRTDDSLYGTSGTTQEMANRYTLVSFVPKAFADVTANRYTVSNNSTTSFILVVPKGTYANLAAAQAALAGTKIQYQLATPVVTEIDSLAIPIVRPNGQVVTTPGAGTVLPSITYTAPTSVQGQIQTLTNAVAELYDAVEAILAAIV